MSPVPLHIVGACHAQHDASRKRSMWFCAALLLPLITTSGTLSYAPPRRGGACIHTYLPTRERTLRSVLDAFTYPMVSFRQAGELTEPDVQDPAPLPPSEERMPHR